MNNMNKLKAIERWQQEPNLKKFKCTVDENHELLKPVIRKNEVLMRCPTCKTLYRCLSEKAFEYGHLLRLQDKGKGRK